MTINKATFTMKLINTIILIAIAFILASCTTNEKTIVRGTPGTIIYHPNGDRLGAIDGSGQVQVQISSNDYCAFLFTQQPNSNEKYAMPLDTRYKNRHDLTWALVTMFPTVFVGYTIYISRYMQQSHIYKYALQPEHSANLPANMLTQVRDPQPRKVFTPAAAADSVAAP